MYKIKLLKFFDLIIGRPLSFFLSSIIKNKKEPSPDIKKLLFIRPGGIGDAVLLIPAINALRCGYPDVEIDILCEKRNSEIFGLVRGINRLCLYDRGIDILRCLKNKYDVVIDTEQWHRLSAVVSYLLKSMSLLSSLTGLNCYRLRQSLMTRLLPFFREPRFLKGDGAKINFLKWQKD
jgi:hypothetical protein